MREGEQDVRGVEDEMLRLSVILRAAVVALLVAGCEPGTPPPQRPVSADEIAALSQQIQEWRRAMGPACDPVRVDLLGMAPPDRFASCKENEDACDVALAICDNAEAICTLAAERGNDVWSNDKCVSANRACRDARACVHPAEGAPQAPLAD